MQPETISFLLDLNHQFYQTFAQAFANTRRRIQPGIYRILQEIDPQGDWLDIGCGSGALGVEWIKQARRGSYLGLDFSSGLLDEARRSVAELTKAGLTVEYQAADLGKPDWDAGIQERQFEGILAFASLHHLPAFSERQRLLRQVRARLKDGGVFIHSEWQFQHSPKLMARRLPWETVGLSADAVEPGDTLLDWRHALPGQQETIGYRYVHLFDREELSRLAAGANFEIINEFESDGKEGNLALYQVWRAI
jgi:SAM-dependent methyltransferase